MAESEHEQDRVADHNLRKIGRRLPLPAEPTARQKTYWKSGAPAAAPAATAAPAIEISRGDRLMRRVRYATVAGSAVAAGIALLAFFVIPLKDTRVEAATILDTFRDTQWSGLFIKLDQIGDDGFVVNGEVLLTFTERISLSDLVAGNTAAAHTLIDSFWVDADVRAHPDAKDEDLAGLDLEAKFSASRGESWVFVKIKHVPEALYDEEPMAAVIMNMFRGGMLIDLGGLLEEHLWQPDENDEAVNGHIEIVHEHVAEAHDVEVDLGSIDNEELEETLKGFLTGEATPQQIEQLVTHLEEAAEEVRVEEVEPGLHVLTAARFHVDNDDEFMERLVMEIAYREGHGIEWADLQHVGAYDGSIRLAFTDDVPDRATAERQRLIESGVQRLDLSAFKSMFQPALDCDGEDE